MFPLLFSSPTLYKTKSRDHSGRSNIYETPKSFFVELEAAGFTRDSLNVSLENSTLKISGQIEIDLPEGFEQLKSRSFSRTFRFSQNRCCMSQGYTLHPVNSSLTSSSTQSNNRSFFNHRICYS